MHHQSEVYIVKCSISRSFTFPAPPSSAGVPIEGKHFRLIPPSWRQVLKCPRRTGGNQIMTTAMTNASECVIFRQKCNIRSLPFSRFICAKGSLKTSIPLFAPEIRDAPEPKKLPPPPETLQNQVPDDHGSSLTIQTIHPCCDRSHLQYVLFIIHVFPCFHSGMLLLPYTSLFVINWIQCSSTIKCSLCADAYSPTAILINFAYRYRLSPAAVRVSVFFLLKTLFQTVFPIFAI